MKNITIPKTDLTVSNVCMGTVNFGSTVDQKESFRILDRFAERGGNFLDTAKIYADWVPGAERSASEKMLGRWLKERGNQQAVVVATKGGHMRLGEKKPTLERNELIRQVEESCKFLQVDAIPLYYLHRDDDTVDVTYIMDTLFSQQDRGLIRYLGCSNWRADRIRQANAYAAACDRTGFVAVSNRWSLANCIPGSQDPTLVDMNEDLYRLHREQNLAAIPFSSTAGGYLSKLAEGRPVRSLQKVCYGVPENDVLAARAKQLAQEKGVTVAQLAIAYFYCQDFTAIPITAFSSDDQMDETVAATELYLTPEEYSYLMNGTKVL